MITIGITGRQLDGKYRVDCECGDHWDGQAEQINLRNYSPALPIAEAVVHHKMAHEHQELALDFTLRYRQWLISYWNGASIRMHGHVSGR